MTIDGKYKYLLQSFLFYHSSERLEDREFQLGEEGRHLNPNSQKLDNKDTPPKEDKQYSFEEFKNAIQILNAEISKADPNNKGIQRSDNDLKTLFNDLSGVVNEDRGRWGIFSYNREGVITVEDLRRGLGSHASARFKALAEYENGTTLKRVLGKK